MPLQFGRFSSTSAIRPGIVSGGFFSPQRLMGGGVTVTVGRDGRFSRSDPGLNEIFLNSLKSFGGASGEIGDGGRMSDDCFSGSGDVCTGGRDRACDDESGCFSESDGCEDTILIIPCVSRSSMSTPKWRK